MKGAENAHRTVELPLREASKTGWLSGYRRFWRGNDWEPFLLPSSGGFAVSRIVPACHEGTNKLMDQPGTYELALIKDDPSKRYKVYLGQTGSIRRRFHQEYRGVQGSHLKSFFEEALRNGCQIWRRCRYTATVEEARKAEARYLKQYDYAWNVRQAGCQPRHVNIITKQHCFSKQTHLVARPAKAASVQVNATATRPQKPAGGLKSAAVPKPSRQQKGPAAK